MKATMLVFASVSRLKGLKDFEMRMKGKYKGEGVSAKMRGRVSGYKTGTAGVIAREF